MKTAAVPASVGDKRAPRALRDDRRKGSSSMATASGTSESRRKSVMPVVAYGVVLALLVAAGAFAFVMGSGRGPGGKAGTPVTDIDAARTARALKLPPRPSPSEKSAPEKSLSEKAPSEKTPSDKVLPEKAAVEMAPAKAATVEAVAPAKPESIATPATPPAGSTQAEGERKPEPPKTACKVDLTRWPNDKSDQAQAIQMMLRDLGYYRGTTNGTAGPQTRAAIREFQVAVGESDNGEIGESLFEALKKKCAASP
ncbi:MAG: peptidoglycan-binding protein [Reyranella sp.]|nr:peptidoglycan-binding protein [Reyranella sp.]